VLQDDIEDERDDEDEEDDVRDEKYLIGCGLGSGGSGGRWGGEGCQSWTRSGGATAQDARVVAREAGAELGE
jgi:hypothetical protein